MVFYLFVFILLFCPSFSAAAEPQPEHTMPPVVVSASRLPDVQQPITQVAGNVVVISAAEIEKLGAKTIPEVLQFQPGVILYDTVGNEFQQTVDLRGFNGQPVTATSVFVDGVRVNEPDFNTVNFDLIPIEDVERIEIMPGPATVFGRNALGGAIHITTKRGRNDKRHFDVDVAGGSFGRQRYSFGSDGPLFLDNFDYTVRFTRELTDGFREASGGRITRFSGKAGYRLSDRTDISLAYIRVLDHLKQAGSLPESRLRLDRNDNFTPGDFSDSDLHQAALNIKHKLPAGFSLALNGFFRNVEQELFTQGLSSISTLQTDTQSGGTTVQLTHDGIITNRKNLLTIGVEYSRNRFDTVNSGRFLSPAFSFVTRQSAKEDVLGVFLTDSFHLAHSLILSGGLRYDWDRLTFVDEIDASLNGRKRYDRISPKAGLVYSPARNFSLSFSYAEGVRIPTVNEIFAQGPFGSNRSLSTMKGRNFEVAAKASVTHWLDASLALFYVPVRDEIFFVVSDPVNFLGRNENIAKTLRRGMELSLKARYQKMLDLFLNYTVTQATFETDVLLASGQVKKGDELPQVPRHRAAVGVNTYPLEGATFSLFGNYVGEQFMIRDEPNHARKLADYFVLNSRISYQWRQWTAYANLNNVTNRKYSTSGILVTEPFRVPAPGFNAFAGVSFRY